MIVVNNECVGCEVCQMPFCPETHVIRCFCDNCGNEVDRLFWVNGKQWCEDCIMGQSEEVDYEDEV